MSRNAESRKRQREAERGIDYILQEDHAALLADLSVNYKRSCYPDPQVPSQDCSQFAIPCKDSCLSPTDGLIHASEDFNKVSDPKVDLSIYDNGSVDLYQNNDHLFQLADDNSDSDEEYCEEYFDYGVSEDELKKTDFPDQLVIYKLDRSDVSQDVWRIITGAKEEPSSEDILKTKLIDWALQFKSVPRNAVDSLLHILNDHGHSSLPLCSKTLLKTPRSLDIRIRIVAGGQFWYRGIFQGLSSVLTEEYLLLIENDEVEMDVFGDGISPYKSVKRHLWPLAGCLVGQKTPFVIAIWCGSSKDPQSVDEYLHDFIEEFKSLRDGFSFLNRNLKLKIRNFIADAPARAWIRKVNQHGSYYSCERCTIKGEWKFRRITYDPSCEATLRTNESFEEQSQPQYHNGTSTLLTIGIAMISQFPFVGWEEYHRIA